MVNFYGRRWELLLNDETFIESRGGAVGLQGNQDFRVTFEVDIDFGGYMSYADIAIYNLSQDTISRAFKRDSVVGLRAGYEENVDYLFRGRIRNIFKERNGPDTATRIIARGGSQPESASIGRTFGTGTRVTEIIRACASAMGYPVVLREEDFSDVAPYPRGYTLDGDPREYLDRLARIHDFSYVVDNERIVVTRNNSYRRGDPYVVSQFTGMEGIPEITEVGCDVSVRLNPKIRIGGRIDVQSELATFNFSNVYFQNVPPNAGKGVYRVFRLVHSGDTWGDTWTTQVTGYR